MKDKFKKILSMIMSMTLLITGLLLPFDFNAFAADSGNGRVAIAAEFDAEYLFATNESPVEGFDITVKSYADRAIYAELGASEETAKEMSLGTPYYETIIYVIGHKVPRIGQESDIDIIRDYLNQGYVVLVVDFKDNQNAVASKIDSALFEIKQSVSNSGKYLEKGIGTARKSTKKDAVFTLLAGYRIERNIVYYDLLKNGPEGTAGRILATWNDKSKTDSFGNQKEAKIPACEWNDNTAGVHYTATSLDQLVRPNPFNTDEAISLDYELGLHIVYPSNPTKETPVHMAASSWEHREGAYAKNPYVEGLMARGYTIVSYDHEYIPMARDDHYGYFDSSNYGYGLAHYLGVETHTAAVRCVRANAYKYGYSDYEGYSVQGNSKASYCSLLGTDEPNNRTEIKEYSEEEKKVTGQIDGVDYASADSPNKTYPDGPKEGQDISARVQGVVSSMGDGTDRAKDIVEEGKTSPTIIACGIEDQFGAWGRWPGIQQVYMDRGVEHLAISMYDKGHEVPTDTDSVLKYDRTQAVIDFIEYNANLPEADVAPSLVYTSPVAGEENYKGEEPITLHFNGAIALSEIENKVTVFDVTANKTLEGVWTASAGNLKYEFEPNDTIIDSHDYKITVGPVVDKNGRAIKNPTVVLAHSTAEDVIKNTYNEAGLDNYIKTVNSSTASIDTKELSFTTLDGSAEADASASAVKIYNNKLKNYPVFVPKPNTRYKLNLDWCLFNNKDNDIKLVVYGNTTDSGFRGDKLGEIKIPTSSEYHKINTWYNQTLWFKTLDKQYKSLSINVELVDVVVDTATTSKIDNVILEEIAPDTIVNNYNDIDTLLSGIDYTNTKLTTNFAQNNPTQHIWFSEKTDSTTTADENILNAVKIYNDLADTPSLFVPEQKTKYNISFSWFGTCAKSCDLQFSVYGNSENGKSRGDLLGKITIPKNDGAHSTEAWYDESIEIEIGKKDYKSLTIMPELVNGPATNTFNVLRLDNVIVEKLPTTIDTVVNTYDDVTTVKGNGAIVNPAGTLMHNTYTFNTGILSSGMWYPATKTAQSFTVYDPSNNGENYKPKKATTYKLSFKIHFHKIGSTADTSKLNLKLYGMTDTVYAPMSGDDFGTVLIAGKDTHVAGKWYDVEYYFTTGDKDYTALGLALKNNGAEADVKTYFDDLILEEVEEKTELDYVVNTYDETKLSDTAVRNKLFAGSDTYLRDANTGGRDSRSIGFNGADKLEDTTNATIRAIKVYDDKDANLNAFKPKPNTVYKLTFDWYMKVATKRCFSIAVYGNTTDTGFTDDLLTVKTVGANDTEYSGSDYTWRPKQTVYFVTGNEDYKSLSLRPSLTGQQENSFACRVDDVIIEEVETAVINTYDDGITAAEIAVSGSNAEIAADNKYLNGSNVFGKIGVDGNNGVTTTAVKIYDLNESDKMFKVKKGYAYKINAMFYVRRPGSGPLKVNLYGNKGDGFNGELLANGLTLEKYDITTANGWYNKDGSSQYFGYKAATFEFVADDNYDSLNLHMLVDIASKPSNFLTMRVDNVIVEETPIVNTYDDVTTDDIKGNNAFIKVKGTDEKNDGVTFNDTDDSNVMRIGMYYPSKTAPQGFTIYNPYTKAPYVPTSNTTYKLTFRYYFKGLENTSKTLDIQLYGLNHDSYDTLKNGEYFGSILTVPENSHHNDGEWYNVEYYFTTGNKSDYTALGLAFSQITDNSTDSPVRTYIDDLTLEAIDSEQEIQFINYDGYGAIETRKVSSSATFEKLECPQNDTLDFDGFYIDPLYKKPATGFVYGINRVYVKWNKFEIINTYDDDVDVTKLGISVENTSLSLLDDIYGLDTPSTKAIRVGGFSSPTSDTAKKAGFVIYDNREGNDFATYKPEKNTVYKLTFSYLNYNNDNNTTINEPGAFSSQSYIKLVGMTNDSISNITGDDFGTVVDYPAESSYSLDWKQVEYYFTTGDEEYDGLGLTFTTEKSETAWIRTHIDNLKLEKVQSSKITSVSERLDIAKGVLITYKGAPLTVEKGQSVKFVYTLKTNAAANGTTLAVKVGSQVSDIETLSEAKDGSVTYYTTFNAEESGMASLIAYDLTDAAKDVEILFNVLVAEVYDNTAVKCDTNLDGAINVVDILRLKRYIDDANIEISGDYSVAADVDEDEQVDVDDLSAERKCLLDTQKIKNSLLSVDYNPTNQDGSAEGTVNVTSSSSYDKALEVYWSDENGLPIADTYYVGKAEVKNQQSSLTIGKGKAIPAAATHIAVTDGYNYNLQEISVETRGYDSGSFSLLKDFTKEPTSNVAIRYSGDTNVNELAAIREFRTKLQNQIGAPVKIENHTPIVNDFEDVTSVSGNEADIKSNGGMTNDKVTYPSKAVRIGAFVPNSAGHTWGFALYNNQVVGNQNLRLKANTNYEVSFDYVIYENVDSSDLADGTHELKLVGTTSTNYSNIRGKTLATPLTFKGNEAKNGTSDDVELLVTNSSSKVMTENDWAKAKCEFTTDDTAYRTLGLVASHDGSKDSYFRAVIDNVVIKEVVESDTDSYIYITTNSNADENVTLANAALNAVNSSDAAYIIKNYGDELVINADNLYALDFALDKFIDTLKATDNATLAPNHVSISTVPAGAITVNGNSIADYSIIHSDTYSLIESKAKDYLVSTILAKTGKLLPVYTDKAAEKTNEIVIGDTTRIDSADDKYDMSASGTAYTVKVEGNKIYVYGESTSAVNAGVIALANKLNTVGNITADFTGSYDETKSLTDDYGLVYSEDFAGDSINTKTWKQGITTDEDRKETYNTYDSDLTKNSTVANGVLTAKAMKTNDQTAGGTPKTSNFVMQSVGTDSQYFRYGYVETRAKLSDAVGYKSTLWLRTAEGQRYGSYFYGEFDVVESFGSGNVLTPNLHVHSKVPGIREDILQDATKNYTVGYKTSLEKLGGEYHNYGMDWNDDYINFYIDGELFYSFDCTIKETYDALDQISSLIFHFRTDPQAAGIKYSDVTADSSETHVDYIRVWQKNDPTFLYIHK